ncbi:MAG: disulfide bond formation protein B [Salinisphaeraceae bacterium]|nr:disulfide bond formation protein B [Salinisphaeraceae bacterium]
MFGITPTGRTGFVLGFLACAGALVFAYYLEYFHGLEPCPMCIFQRIAMAATGLGFLLGIFIARPTWGRWLAGIIALVGTIAGAIIAGRHVWLQSLPEDKVPACGPPLETLTNMMPWIEVFQVVLRGDGNCAVIDAAFLGLSLPAWTFIAFVGLGLWALFCAFTSGQKSN